MKIFTATLILLIYSAASSPAHADMNYSFISMTCDQSNQKVSIKYFWDWNQDGQERTEDPGANTLALGIVGAQPLPKSLRCDLDDGRTVSVIARRGPAGHADSVKIYLDGAALWPEYWPFEQWSATVNPESGAAWAGVYCPASVFGLFDLPLEEVKEMGKRNIHKCQTLDIDGSHIVDVEEINPPQAD